MKKTVKRVRHLRASAWSAADLETLKGLAGKTPVAAIAKRLKRTLGATRQKAKMLGISVRISKEAPSPQKRSKPKQQRKK
jgi:hypothetical protein